MASPEPIPGRCGAKVPDREQPDGTMRQGGFCVNWPMKGQRRCQKHGGRAKQNMQAAAVRDVEQRAEAALVKRGAVAPIDAAGAIDALERMIGLTVQKAEWFNAELDRLIDSGDLTVTTVSQGEQLRATALASERWLKEARAAAADYLRLGMDERRLRLDTAKTKMGVEAVVAVLDAACESAGLSEAQKLAVRRAVGERL